MSDGMVAETTEELINRFIVFYRDYYQEEIEQLAQNYPDKQRSLYIDYADLEEFDPDIAEDYLNQPDHMRPYAEEALSRIEQSIDVGHSLARVRLFGLPDTPLEPGTIRVEDDVIGTLVTVRGYVTRLTPTLAQTFPDIAEKYGVVDWVCSVCAARFEWDAAQSDLPLCRKCAADG